MFNFELIDVVGIALPELTRSEEEEVSEPTIL